MDAGILQSIETRRGALYDCYDLPPDARAEAEDLFGRMEEMGRGCADRAEFERSLLTSPLTDEYSGLYTAFAQYVRQPEGAPTIKEIMREGAADNARSSLRNRAEVEVRSAIFRMLPEPVRQWSLYGIYNVPVLGPLVSAINTAGQFRRLFRRRPKPEATQPDGNE